MNCIEQYMRLGRMVRRSTQEKYQKFGFFMDSLRTYEYIHTHSYLATYLPTYLPTCLSVYVNEFVLIFIASTYDRNEH
jgi:hypothetical protein